LKSSNTFPISLPRFGNLEGKESISVSRLLAHLRGNAVASSIQVLAFVSSEK